MTYAQVMAESALHRRNVSRQPTAVITDEVHHLCESEKWGEAAVDAFEMAAYRIHLSGTPWSRKGRIPWIAYNEAGESIANMTYGYREALIDKDERGDSCVCDVFFPQLGGNAEWDFDGEIHRATSGDPLSEDDQRRWLNTMLTVGKSDLIARAFRQADAELSSIRALGQDRAGGLVIAKDIEHAQQIADKVMAPVLGYRPPVVCNDDPFATTTIRNFRKSTERWIVSVRMVSEGVDIPRLRVLLWATNVRQRLTFQQIIGRVIRGGTPPAVAYIPADPQLLIFAQEIKEMRNEALREDEKDGDDDGDGPGEGGSRESQWAPRRGESDDQGILHDSEHFKPTELELARSELAANGAEVGLTSPVVAAVARMRRSQSQNPADVEPETIKRDQPTISERKDALRKQQNKIVAAFTYRTVASDGRTTAEIAAECNTKLNKAVPPRGISKLRDATEEQLRERLRLAKEWYGL
jgi:superfamily II DNA or RNA helicase